MTLIRFPSRIAYSAAALLVCIVVYCDRTCSAQPTPSPNASKVSALDLASIRIEADALKSEQMALGKKLVSEYPESFNVSRIMGFVHSTHGNQDQMVACWKRCQTISPNRPDIYDQLGRHAFTTEAYQEAVDYWKKAIAIDPKFPGVYRRMGEALIAAGQSSEAIPVLQQQLAQSPYDPETHYQLGEALFQQQDYSKAKTAYLAATKANAQFSKAWYGLVKTSARLGDAKGAAQYGENFQKLEQAAIAADQEYRRTFDDLQEIRSDVAVTFVDAGRIYAADKKLEQALKLWTRATEIDKTNELARNFAAKVLLSQKKPKAALRYMQQLVKISPKNPVYHRQVGMLMASTQQIPGAEKHLRRVVELAPKDADGYRMLAKFYLNTGRNVDLAYQLAVKATQLESVADSYFVLGWASAQTKKTEQARRALGRAIEMDPKNQTYRKLYDSIFRASSNSAQEAP